MVEQPITAGLLKGKTINMHLTDRHGNETSPSFSIDDQKRHRTVVDYEENKVMFKDPEQVLRLAASVWGSLRLPPPLLASAHRCSFLSESGPQTVFSSGYGTYCVCSCCYTPPT